MKADKEGKFMFTKDTGSTVINYVTGNKKLKERIKEIRDKVDSDIA